MTHIHLCQPDLKKSCAACCGIYNYTTNTKEELTKRFQYRVKLFSSVRQGTLTIDEYKEVIRHREDLKRIYKTIYTCEFVGFLDGKENKVGCMLHPMQNGGEDLRGVSFYGKELCEGHFCPSYQKLDDNEVMTVLNTIDDWYLYGAVITDIDFIKTFFKIVQEKIGEAINPEKVKNNKKLRDTFIAYCSLKTNWQFRDTSRPRFGKYYFEGEEYMIDEIDYHGVNKPEYDRIYLSLASKFASAEEVYMANHKLNMIVNEFAYEYRNFD